MKSSTLVLVTGALALGAAGCGSAGKDAVSTFHSSPRGVTVKRVSTSTSTTGAESSGRPPQNDDYISTYGHEAKEPEGYRIAQLVSRYYAAALKGNGVEACSLVYSTLARSVAKDYGGATGLRNTSCGVVLPKLFKHAPGLSMADLASTRVRGVRLRGDNGFVQLSSRAMPTGEISITREGRSWKLGALVGRACRRCSIP